MNADQESYKLAYDLLDATLDGRFADQVSAANRIMTIPSLVPTVLMALAQLSAAPYNAVGHQGGTTGVAALSWVYQEMQRRGELEFRSFTDEL